MLPCGAIDLSKHLNDAQSNLEIVQAKLSTDLKQLCVMVKNFEQLQLITFTNNILWKHTEPLLNLAIKHNHILNTMT